MLGLALPRAGALLLAALAVAAADRSPPQHSPPQHSPPQHSPPQHQPPQHPQHKAAAHKPPAKPAPPVIAAPAPPPPTVEPAAPTKGSVTGMLLPRFAALKTDEVNLRTGPGLRYPIQWVYKRRDLPVQIEREFEVWRLISDQDGERGWVNQATLTGRRTFVVKPDPGNERTVRSDARPDGAPVARLRPGVIGRIRACEATSDWCQVQVGDYRGWLQRDALWGIYPSEAVQ